jgi:hypothetical protein
VIKHLDQFPFEQNVLMEIGEGAPVVDANCHKAGYVDDVFLGAFQKAIDLPEPLRNGYVHISGLDDKDGCYILPGQIERVEEGVLRLNVPRRELINEAQLADCLA